MDTDRKRDFTERFVRSQRQVYGYIVTRLVNRDDAEDVFQQTCLILWEKWDQFDPGREFVPWACGIANNVVRNFLRRKQREGVYLSDELMADVAQSRLKTERMLEARSRALSECLDKLPGRQRELIGRCYLGKETIKTIALEMELQPPALYKRLQRIRQVLFECIDLAMETETVDLQ